MITQEEINFGKILGRLKAFFKNEGSLGNYCRIQEIWDHT